MANPKRPRDPNQRAKLIVDIAVGESDEPKAPDESDAAAFGRAGGLKGGKARARKLTPDRRREIAQRAAKARWTKRAQPAGRGNGTE